MSKYRRWRVDGGVYFFTVVTYQRLPLFDDSMARRFLREAIENVQRLHPFQIPAIVLLPDHLHLIMQLPSTDRDYSTRLRQIKTLFTKRISQVMETKPVVGSSRSRRHEHTVWQRRFYEHCVRDEDDFQRCSDYVHVNPVKHGYVQRVRDWPWSTYHQWFSAGYYENGWGDGSDWFGDEFRRYE